MASDSVELSTLTAERNLINSRTEGQDIIASEARIERDEISESKPDGAVALEQQHDGHFFSSHRKRGE